MSEKVIVIWDYPQLTEDPTASAIKLETGEIEKVTIDCTNFRTGGRRLIPGEDDKGDYTICTKEEDQFKLDNPGFPVYPLLEDRYLLTAFGRGIVGAFDIIEEMFLDYFEKKYEVIKITRLRDNEDI